MDKEEQGYWDHVLIVSKLTDEIERLREALTDLDKGINSWITTYSAIKKTLLKIIDDALKGDK